MRSAVLQFLVAGALVVAWIWMLGRPLLTMLARRSRRDSVDHFRYQQAVLGRSVDDDFERWERLARFHPVADWRAQPVHRRRLQILLGFALATFASLLLAIALRGVFIRLVLVMTVAFSAQLLVAAFIGSRELRAAEAERRLPGAVPMRVVDRAEGDLDDGVGVAAASTAVDDRPVDERLLEGNGIADGLFDEGFFEPIPELERLAEPAARSEIGDRAVELDDRLDEQADDEGFDQAVNDAVHDEGFDEAAASAEAAEPTFSSPSGTRNRPPRRPKARPIYIESELDEADGSVRAVGD